MIRCGGRFMKASAAYPKKFAKTVRKLHEQFMDDP